MTDNARTELTDNDIGVWTVTCSSGSVYRFDLDMRTVERVGGEPRATAAPSDSLQPLRGIVQLRVGERGRWWISNLSGGYADPTELWQWSSPVVSVQPDESDPAFEGRLRTDVIDAGQQFDDGETTPSTAETVRFHIDEEP